MTTTTSNDKQWPTIFDIETCTRKGECPVAKIRGQSEALEKHTVYFEQHGSGPEKIVFIMGLNSSSFAWYRQVKYFSRTGKHSVLVFDNRGVGNSSAPKGPYTTSGMAEDTLTLLSHIGWTEDIHIVGVSMGGMVAQELATRIPDQIVSLSLVVTKAGGLSLANLTPWKGLWGLTRATFTKDPFKRVPIVLRMIFPDSWLDAPNADDPNKRTNRQLQTEHYIRRIEFTRPQTLAGSLSQISAALTHKVTKDRHRLIATSIPKILILTGDKDDLVNPANSKELAKRMPEAEYIQWKDTAHCLHEQWPAKFNELLERVFEEGRTKYEERKSSTVA
ncbi:hypothetical protein M422DRAFT_168948 [Sphaerobolus stellatus SS14]|uniref:AB hydrolase-1 domain-containing protein n=1 Tax=Sphaerobolus stellatus (strain SS14) TaxID=990650 RepID=A0A0C9VZL8_SPHS4|nr:hypothetical protein M422DRAFT_168948 [Sphaerobolus stellatus SS14]